MTCDMCGKDGELFRAKIEETIMNVCKNCSKYGSFVKEVKVKHVQQRKQFERQEVIEVVVKNYAQLIRHAREKNQVNQEDFARDLNVKLSLLHNMEGGKFKPSLKLARKLEKLLHIRLIEQQEESQYDQAEHKDTAFTLGDFIKKKKNNK